MDFRVIQTVWKRRRWGHHIYGKVQQGDARVNRKSAFTYLDSLGDDKEEEWGKGKNEEEEEEK